MKRDPEIIRNILLALEANEEDPYTLKRIEIEGVPAWLVSYQIELLHGGGFLHADDATSDEHDWIPTRLTWQGHELLDAIRDDTIWRRTKEKLEKVGGWTVPILQDVATSIIRQQLAI